MRWFKRRKKATAEEYVEFNTTFFYDLCGVEVDVSTKFDLKVAGTSYHQTTLSFLAESVDEYSHLEALLVPDRRNAYDQNAVQVLLKGSNKDYYCKVGYIPRDIAEVSRPMMDLLPEGYSGFKCQAVLVGGSSGKQLFGVRLNMPLVYENEV